MSKTNIEWATHRWNVYTGCSRLCEDYKGIYCYAYYMALRQKGRNGYDAKDPFKPTFHLDKLLVPLSIPDGARIFTSSMGDLFDEGVLELWRDLIIRVMQECPNKTFIILTKRPENIPRYEVPEAYWPANLWLGVSIDGRNTTLDHLDSLIESDFYYTTIASFEPLLGRIDGIDEYDSLVDWVIVGAQTGARRSQPEWEWVEDILAYADRFRLPVFMKDNLILPEGVERRQEYPEARKL